MDTDEHEPDLLRRIEELAAQAGDDDAPEGPILAAAFWGLREEIGALRSDLTSLRADISAVRGSVDANINGLAEVLDGVAAALPGLREELAQLPAGTEALDATLRRIEETLLTRVDTAVGDLRRTISTGLTQASAGSRAAESAANDTRSVLEERLAAV